MDEYAATNLKTLENVFKDFKKISGSIVKLDSGERAVRVVITDTQMNFSLRQTFYFMAGPASKGKMLVITCTALAEKGADLDDTFERSIKTFTVEK